MVSGDNGSLSICYDGQLEDMDLPSHQLTWKCAQPLSKRKVVSQRGSVHFHVSQREGTLTPNITPDKESLQEEQIFQVPFHKGLVLVDVCGREGNQFHHTNSATTSSLSPTPHRPRPQIFGSPIAMAIAHCESWQACPTLFVGFTGSSTSAGNPQNLQFSQYICPNTWQKGCALTCFLNASSPQT